MSLLLTLWPPCQALAPMHIQPFPILGMLSARLMPLDP